MRSRSRIIEPFQIMQIAPYITFGKLQPIDDRVRVLHAPKLFPLQELRKLVIRDLSLLKKKTMHKNRSTGATGSATKLEPAWRNERIPGQPVELLPCTSNLTRVELY